VIELLIIVISVRGNDALRDGNARAYGDVERVRRGQLLGTEIRHAPPAPRAALTLAIPVIEAPLLATPVAAPGLPSHPNTGQATTGRPAVEVAAIAPSADREYRAAERAGSDSMVAHVLARADLLPRSSSRARLHPSTRPRST